jgi:uncharacterized membrane protein
LAQQGGVKIGYRPTLRVVVVGLALTGYVLLSHHASSLPPDQGVWSAVVALLPWFVVAVIVAWRSRHRYAWLLLVAGLVAVGWRFLAPIGDHAPWVYFIQHAGGNAIMALVFGSSLVGAREPLCARLAGVIHGPLEPRLAHYTRQVTLAWTIFFAGTATLSALLFAYAPIHIWSIFANLLAIPLVAFMFAAEYGVRLRLLPDIEHIPFLGAIRLYFRTASASPPPSA